MRSWLQAGTAAAIAASLADAAAEVFYLVVDDFWCNIRLSSMNQRIDIYQLFILLIPWICKSSLLVHQADEAPVTGGSTGSGGVQRSSYIQTQKYSFFK